MTSKAVCKNGFTLIELLVVVAIIALLLSILLPALSRVREEAKNTLCSTRLNQIGYALLMYSHDNGDFIPWARYVGGDWPYPALDAYLHITRALRENINRSPWFCPSEIALRTPSDWTRVFDYHPTTYSWNGYAVPYAYVDGGVWRGPNFRTAINRLTYPSDCLWLADGVWNGTYWNGLVDSTPWGRWHWTWAMMIPVYGPAPHNGGVNLLFFDGHVGYNKAEEIIALLARNGWAETFWWPYGVRDPNNP